MQYNYKEFHLIFTIPKWKWNMGSNIFYWIFRKYLTRKKFTNSCFIIYDWRTKTITKQKETKNINEEEEIEADELSNDDIQEINDNNNDDNDDNDEDETEDEINDNETVTQSAKKRQRAETDEVTDVTPRKRNKTNPNKLTIQLDQSKYSNIKNTVKHNLRKIQQLIHEEVET